MTWEHPNLPPTPTSLQTAASTVFACDMQALIVAQAGNGVISGCTLAESGTPDMNVVVAAGLVRINGVNYAVTGGNAAISSNASGNPRIDLISVDASDTITVTAGTAAATPDAPEIPTGDILLGLVYVADSEAALIDAEIFNRQVIVENPYAGIDSIAFTDPTTQSWTALNHGTGVYTEDTTNKCLYMREIGDATNRIRGWHKSAPATPYTITAYIESTLIRSHSNGPVLFFRESATGELVTIDIISVSAVPQEMVYNWNSESSISTNLATATTLEAPQWVQITDNGTNLIFSISPDGISWIQIHSVGRTAWMAGGPDQVGFGMRCIGASAFQNAATLLSWLES